MALENYSIGSSVVEVEGGEAITELPQNRVLLAERLTSTPSVRPEIVEGLTNTEQVFAHFQPQVSVAFETEAGGICREKLSFSSVSDFGISGITKQSALLSDLNAKKQEYQGIIRQLKSNKLLQKALSEPEYKTAMLNALSALIADMEATA